MKKITVFPAAQGRNPFPLVLLLLAAVLLTPSASAQTALSFDKTFTPDTIGPGSVATLRFDIGNSSSLPVQDLGFTDTLPAGMTVASPANASTTCGGTVDATAGGGTIVFSGGAIGAGSSCSVSVAVTSATPGTRTNVSGDLTSELGSHGTATADLTVATDRPGFLKAFAPDTVLFGGRSTMTLTIDNSANGSDATNLAFTDNLPRGMEVASPNNLANTCGGTVSAVEGGTTISLSGFFPNPATVAAGATCSIAVDVLGKAVGDLGNTTGELTSTPPVGTPTRTSGKAGAVLTVTNDRILLDKSFTDDPVPPGGTVTLRFELKNIDRSATATAISFTDDLGAVLSGLVATDTPLADPCGAGSSLSGSSVLSFTGGTLGAGESCAFEATLQVPSDAPSATYLNETSQVSADLGGLAVTTAAASDVLTVAPVPVLTKEFTDDPVGGAGSVTLEFTLTNTSTVSSATDLAFTDELDAIIVSASSLPANGFCGSSSTLTFTPPTSFQPSTISVSGASLAAGASCTFSVVLDVVVGAPAGSYPNTTSAVTGVVGGQALTGSAATDSLEVTGGPRLGKEFTDDPVAAGGTLTLQFTLTHDEDAPADAVDIAFTDDLDATLAGLVATGLPATDVCGIGSQISGTSTLSFTGGVLAPGETCTVSVALQVPGTAAPGPHPNTTSSVVSTVAGEPVVSFAATDELRIAGLTLTKEFVDDPVLPGATASLRFTVDNINPTEDATGISFLDDLDAVISGLTASGLPVADVCGAGSSLSQSAGVLVFDGGSLTAGTSCTFDVTLQVPSGTDTGQYANFTSGFSGVFGGQTAFFEDARDALFVQSEILSLSKEFVDDPASPGDTVTLQFEISNLSAMGPITAIGFTDDLDAALSGLVSVSGTLSDVCGAGSELSGTSLLTFSGGTLAGGASCTFDVTLQVPSTAPFGAEGLNTTSPVTGEISGIPVEGSAASDVLQIDSVVFTKAFDGPTSAGDTVSLTFAIQNLDTGDGVDGLEFFDDLSAVVPGLSAVGLPASEVCGTGSVLDGTGFLTFTGGSLLPGGSCSFQVTLQVPASAPAGSFENVTSDLTVDGLAVAVPAVDTLVIEEDLDSDGDGVLDGLDVCPDTVIPEGVPTVRLGVNRYALVDGDGVFDTTPPPARGNPSGDGNSGGPGPGETFTIEDTAGCSCEQIIEAQGLGRGHVRFGCSIGVMRDWVDLVNP